MPSLVGRYAGQNQWWRRVRLWLPPLLYMAVIFHLSSESNPLPVLTQHVWDKALHGLEYGGLGLLLCRALRGEGFGWSEALTLALVATSAYGASDEWHQLYTPGRTADVHDWLADTFGAAVGLAFYVLAASTGWILRSTRKSARN
jgi:VanZ family protein